MRRVVITGMGMVSSLGNNVATSWEALIAGKSGIEQFINDPVLKNSHPYNLALVKNFDYKKWKVPHATNRMNSFLNSAVSEALNDANLDLKNIDRKRAGICLGILSANITKLAEQMEQAYKDHYKSINRLNMLQILTNIPAATLNVQYQLQGPSLTVSTACASGLSAIVEAMKWIRLGQADYVIAGATQDVYNPLYLNSSLKLQAMSSKQYPTSSQSSRPFDKLRSGFILGEGSGIVIVESLQNALRRKAPIYAEITGYGYTSDGFHLVRPQDSGEGQIRAMKMALQMSQILPTQIDHINVHATSTEAGDIIQAKAIQSVFGQHAKQASISAIKSSIGHAFGAAGVIETIFGLMSMKNNIAPKILNLIEPAVSGLNYCQSNQQKGIQLMLKNSFGFGGINVSAIFKKIN